MLAPCLNCQDRCYPTCYAECEKYKAMKAENQAIKDARFKDRCAKQFLNAGVAQALDNKRKTRAKLYINQRH